MRNYTATFLFSLVALSPLSLTRALDVDAGEPVVYRNGTIVFHAKNADEFGGELVTDPFAESDLVLKVSPSTKLYGEVVLQGLGYTFYEGIYVVNFLVRTEGGLGSDRAIAEVEVARRTPSADSDYNVTDMRTITGLLFTSEETYTAVPLRVSLGEPEELEFRVRYLGNAVLYVDRVTVKVATP